MSTGTRRHVMSVALCLLGAAALIAPAAASTNSFVYTNNDRVPNSVSAFAVAANGSLSPVAGSPFLTGGNGSAGGFFASNRITAAIVKSFLYASNTQSNNVSGFSINATTGVLTPVPGSPFATGGSGGSGGISLAVTPDDKYLIASSSGSSTITVFSIAANGSLTPVAGSPFAAGVLPDGIRVTPDGKFLAVASPATGGGRVAMFNILPSGALTPVVGSPFASASAAGVDCNCASANLFVGEAIIGASRVDVYSILPNGALAAIPGSPFSGPGSNSNVPLLSADDTKLFVSNQESSSVSSYTVAPNGALSVVAGSPFATGGLFPVGMATTQDGAFLYVANLDNRLSGFSVAGNGSLTAVPGSPVNIGGPGALFSVAVYPPKSCCPAPAINGASANPASLWPPNHKMVDVRIDYSDTAPCAHSCVLTVASNEPANGGGDGNTSTDWQVINGHHVLLRAERAGNGGDRVYTVTITCTNQVNNRSTTRTVTVTVPHDKGN